MTGEPPARSRTPRAEIVRVEQQGFHGWVVTVWKKGEEHQRRFGEESYASPSAAFAAGVRFRNRIVFGAGAAGGPSKKATGIPGISIGSVRTTSGRYVKHYKVSVYGADGKRRGPVFSWLKYGRKRALELAKKALREGREEARRARRLLKKKPAVTDEEDRLKSALALSKPTEHRNVRRVDHNHFHGYVVALRRVQALLAVSRGGFGMTVFRTHQSAAPFEARSGSRQSVSVRLYADVHVRRAVTEGLRLRGIDILNAQEDGAAQLLNPELLTRHHRAGAGAFYARR